MTDTAFWNNFRKLYACKEYNKDWGSCSHGKVMQSHFSEFLWYSIVLEIMISKRCEKAEHSSTAVFLFFICSDICVQFPAFTINWCACAWKAQSWWILRSCLWLLKTIQCHQWMFSTEQKEVVKSRLQVLNCLKERGKHNANSPI